MMAGAIALISGGLDSQLAAKLVLEQGVEVTGINFLSVFNVAPKPGEKSSAEKAAETLGIPLLAEDITARQLAILRDPPHGFGSAANPCIDCHMTMLKAAAARMGETGADFIVSGEVVGQRPMSQRRPVLEMIDSETGLAGLILRPLSAKILPETKPEAEGLIDREKLEGIEGRSRIRQMELARRFGIHNYPSPAGGCLLTDGGFGARVHDLLSHGKLDLNNARLLKLGRHYRLGPHTKAVVGRQEPENYAIEDLACEDDLLMELAEMTGPMCLLRGEKTEEFLRTAAALTARVSRARDRQAARFTVHSVYAEDEGRIIEVAPATDETAKALSVN